MLPVPVKSLFAPMLMALALSLTGCALQPRAAPPLAVMCPANPAPPQISQPLPKESYSLSVQRRLQNWRERLEATPPMSKP